MEEKKQPEVIKMSLEDQINWIATLSPHDAIVEASQYPGLFSARLGNIFISLESLLSKEAEIDDVLIKLGKADIEIAGLRNKVTHLKGLIDKAFGAGMARGADLAASIIDGLPEIKPDLEEWKQQNNLVDQFKPKE
jgi:hypothetical protein